MKKYIVCFALLFFVMTASASSAPQSAGDKKATTSTAHTQQDKNDCCCGMKSTKGNKKINCDKMDSKKDGKKKRSEAK